MVRSLAVYSLQRVAKLEPARVKPILMTIIENIAERPEVCPWFLIRKAIWYVLAKFRIFTKPIHNFLFKVQNRAGIEFEISNFEISSNLTIPNFLMTSQQHELN